AAVTAIGAESRLGPYFGKAKGPPPGGPLPTIRRTAWYDGVLHPLDHRLAEPRARHLFRAVHQACEVVRDNLVLDRLFEARLDERGGLAPPHVHQHHLGGKDFRSRIDVILAGVLLRG